MNTLAMWSFVVPVNQSLRNIPPKKRVKTHRSNLLPISLLVAVSAVWPHRVGATDILVYNTNNAGAGSLRQAISDNNAIGGGNTIVFSNIVTGAITQTSGELVISTKVVIAGPGRMSWPSAAATRAGYSV